MIKAVKKIPVLRYFLIVLLFSALFVSSIYLYLHYKKAKTLRSSIENLITERENSALIDSCILDLYSADNSSRLYTITGDKTYLTRFSSDINRISNVIDKLKFNSKDVASLDPEKLKELMKEKAQKTDNYIKLRLLTDSLIKSSIGINQALSKMSVKAGKTVMKVEHKVIVDTIRNPAVATTKPQKKLLSRIFSAFSKKDKESPSQQPSKPIIVRDTITSLVVTTPSRTLASNKAAINNYYKKLNDVNNKLRTDERQILIINNNLIEEIISSLKLYKAVEQMYISNSKVELKENLSTVYTEFKQVSVINFIFLVSLLILVFYNIWKIYRNEKDIIFYSEKAEQYADSKSRFLAGMSHEIRTPLNSVIGFSEQLSQGQLDLQQREQIEAIKSSSEMLLELVNEILDFSKYETGKMSFESAPFMLEHAIEDVFINMNIHAQKKKLFLENDIQIDGSICCEGDKIRLKQVIMNLLGNAIKFTVKGRVTLSAYVDEDKETGIVLLKVAVKDTGLGIDKNDLPSIFEEFSQVAGAQKATRHKGTGLGLAICKKIIELQGGKIIVNSVLGEGSVFSFELPLRRCEIDERVLSQSLSDGVMAELVNDKYVLFAEDNQLNVLLGATILKKWKVKYDVATNGHEAIMLFEKNRYDLVLTDIQMPELNGLEVTELIRNNRNAYKSNVPILALTANVLKEDRDMYMSNGVNDVVLKPFREKDLIEKMAVAIQNNTAALRFVS
jgi:signal transduction histidine kinase/CheY-like chemotaxis protein/CHASE3 domain sensor protein